MDLLQVSRGSLAGRRPDLDRLRLFACLLLFPFHTIEVFDLQPAYHIKSATQVLSLEYVSRAIAAWHMPLFFLLSGMAAMFALERRPSLTAFIGGRVRRLLPPLVLGLLTIAPAIKFIELSGGRDMSHSGVELVPEWIAPSAFAFYGSFLSGLEVFSWSHLWFLVYLILLTIALAPLLLWMRRTEVPLPGGSAPVLIWLPLAVILAAELWLRPVWGDLHNLSGDWANIAIYSIMTLAGAALVRWPGLEAHMAGQRALFAGVGVAGLVTMLTAWDGALAGIGRGLANFGIVGFLLGLSPGSRFKVWPVESYLFRAQLSFYVLHHLPLLMLAYLLCDQPWPVAVRFAAIMFGSVAITWGLYHVFVRPLIAPAGCSTTVAAAAGGRLPASPAVRQ